MWFTAILILTQNPTVFLMIVYINGDLKSWWQYAETWLFFMLSPNWPPGKYIRD